MLTQSQANVVAARGHVVVVAGAGAGKTRALVERCLDRVCARANPVSMEEILMVTFTDAAASEMRKRLRAGLAERAAREPGRAWLAEQLALVDTAKISTLHSFCLQLVREHFYELELDPQPVMLSSEQAKLLSVETLDQLLDDIYQGNSETARAIQNLVFEQGQGRDYTLRALVLKTHSFVQSLKDAEGWLQRQEELWQELFSTQWETWFLAGFHEWRDWWLPVVDGLPADHAYKADCGKHLRAAIDTREQMAQCLAGLQEVLARAKLDRKPAWRKPLAKLFEDLPFLCSLAVPDPQAEDKGPAADPLMEDWRWARPAMLALLSLVKQFRQCYASIKREQGALDFQDLEQFALRLLVDPKSGKPTALARDWRKKLALLFVDEYQDINEAQDAILSALAREGAAANRFLVGDVKQSIYRFRQANPHIFQRYAGAQSQAPLNILALNENFRSHEAILNFVNGLFAAIMHPSVGGVEYSEAARLRYGAPDIRPHFRQSEVPGVPRVELHLLVETPAAKADSDSETEDNEADTLSSVELEARLIVSRLLELKTRSFPVWDDQRRNFHPVEWRDIVILLRSPAGKAEDYAKEFARQGVPLSVARGGFFEATEVTDLLSLLQLLDNPLQDLPLLAVLRSPFVGLNAQELALVRLVDRQGQLWGAVLKLVAANPVVDAEDTLASAFPALEPFAEAVPPLVAKLGQFLRQYRGWRAFSRQGSLSQCLESILAETLYEAWAAAQDRGEQRRANIQRLLLLTRQFDQFQRQGLFRFLKFVEAQQEAEIDAEPAAIGSTNAVRLMSIHKSKGLEFPIVVVADLGKSFNLKESQGRVFVDEYYGLCPRIQPPQTRQHYPSLPHWLAVRRQKRESLGEEVRLLYVALTRACDLLILSGSITAKKLESWSEDASTTLPPQQIMAASSMLDWLGKWLPAGTGCSDWTQSGQSALLRWVVYSVASITATASAAAPPLSTPILGAPSPAEIDQLCATLSWQYPHQAATREPAKSTVTALRRRAVEAAEETRILWPVSSSDFAVGGSLERRELTAAEIGTAHHAFMQWAALDKLDTITSLQAEAARMVEARLLSPQEQRALNYESILAFWQSEAGLQVRQQVSHIQRELPFTARFSFQELHHMGIPLLDLRALQTISQTNLSIAGEYLIVQGVVDLAVIMPREIWLLDYKTDQVSPDRISHKVNAYRPQILLYATALNRIYQRPVTQRWLYFLVPGKIAPVE